MSQLKIPNFLSNKLAACKSPQEKQNLINTYKSWCESPITKMFAQGLQKEWEKQTEKEDSKLEFLNRFQSDFSAGKTSGYRKALKQLQKQLNVEVI